MKIRLRFTERHSELQLGAIAVWDDAASKSPKPDREVFAAVDTDPGADVQLFQWTSSVRAFCLLMLRGSLLSDLLSASLKGGKGSAARSLVELITQYMPIDESNWIQYLFKPYLKIHEKGFRISSEVIKPRSNSKVSCFIAQLGPRWKGSKIEIFTGEDHEKLLPVGPLQTQQMADYLAATFKASETQALKRLRADLELFAWSPMCQQLMAIQDSRLPLPVKSGVSLKVTLSRPAYAYVVWITSSGAVQPLYPWQEFDWLSQREVSSVTELRLPSDSSKDKIFFYPINSAPGVETAIIMAAEKPLAKAVAQSLRNLATMVKRAYPRSLPDPKILYRLSDPRPVDLDVPPVRLGQPTSVHSPMTRFMERLVQETGCVCECVAGVSFVTTS